MSQQQDNKKIIKFETKSCDLCGETGLVEAVEMLPGGGILFECKHDNGKTHEWGEYENIDSYRNIKIDRGNNPEIKCPKCTEIGVIKTEREDPKRPDRYLYRISHPDGHKCRMSGNNRVDVLKYLNRYIPPFQSTEVEKEQEQEPQKLKSKLLSVHQRKREQIICPRCDVIGSSACYPKKPNKQSHFSYRVFHNKGDGSNYQHTMKTFEEMVCFYERTGPSTLDKTQREGLELKIFRLHQANADRIRKMFDR